VYLDDTVLYASSLREHEIKFEKLAARLRNANLKLQPDKCEFLRKEVTYLGHIIGEDGVKPDPKKVEAVREFPQPTNQKTIKQFLPGGLLSPIHLELFENSKTTHGPVEKGIRICLDRKTTRGIHLFARRTLLPTDPSIPGFHKTLCCNHGRIKECDRRDIDPRPCGKRLADILRI